MALTDSALADLAHRLLTVPGVVGVVLGGSRARGTHTEDSDTDLGLYYRAPLDTGRLGELAREVAGPGTGVTATGGWGPWVDGGGWLRIDGHPVDWVYRDLDRVERCWPRRSRADTPSTCRPVIRSGCPASRTPVNWH
jgi:hypothetical protein